jgi:hypothetical protein
MKYGETQNPRELPHEGFDKAGDNLLSRYSHYHGPQVLNGRVRNGNGCGHLGMVTGKSRDERKGAWGENPTQFLASEYQKDSGKSLSVCAPCHHAGIRIGLAIMNDRRLLAPRPSSLTPHCKELINAVKRLAVSTG